MSSDALAVVRSVFTDIWSLFTSWRIPGTDISPAAWALFSLFFILILQFIIRIFGDGSLDSNGSSSSPNRREK